jgi:AraC-like DNA-binding protein
MGTVRGPPAHRQPADRGCGFPAAPCRSATTGAGDTALRLVPSHTAALRLLTGYLRSVLDGPILLSTELAIAVVTHLTGLIALCLPPPGLDTGNACTPTVRAARLSAIKADIDRRRTDSSLTAAAVAARHGITTRYLQRLFETDTRTYSQYVLERRLNLAYRRLQDPRYAYRTISSIANDDSVTCPTSTERSADATHPPPRGHGSRFPNPDPRAADLGSRQRAACWPRYGLIPGTGRPSSR